MHNNINSLTEQISNGLKLSPDEIKAFKSIVISWENSVEIMARVEPPGEHDEDDKLMKVYDQHEATYDELYSKASPRVKEAFDFFLKLRSD